LHRHELSLSARQELDLSLCEREPIHIPGAIQPHGAVIAALADGLLVTHVSANLPAILGVAAEDILGRPLKHAIGKSACRELSASTGQDALALERIRAPLGTKGPMLNLHAHWSGQSICIDLGPARKEPGRRSAVTMVPSVLESFNKAKGSRELCELAVRGLKAMTRYDRVMAYRFSPDGHGEVIAEACEEGAAPYLGLCYPASDIPPQARRQYLLHPIGAIADSSYEPVPLLVDPALGSAAPLDLTHSALRSVSPVHREYMRNMKTAASLTIGLADGPRLWGMLVCHHATPRVAGPELRAVAATIGQVMSLMLASLGEAEIHTERLERTARLRTLIRLLESPLSLTESIAAAESELLRLVDAGGALIRISGTLISLGHTPPPAGAERALKIMSAAADGDVLAMADIALRYRELAGCVSHGSGALLLPLDHGADEAILWFRPEISRTVTWGGNPSEHATLKADSGRLSPRASFAAWKEIVRGRSAPWTSADEAIARELRRAIAAERARRTKEELASLRHYDSLTGLPNRGLLLERLAEVKHDSTTSLLFLDLDRFKVVNDTLGHAAGDRLLVDVAQRLLSCAGPGNMVARLGGDEFVLLYDPLDRGTLTAIADRIRRIIEQPFEIDGRPCYVSASIGIATADQLGGDLIRAADMAMYAAKQSGGNRWMLYEASLHDRATGQFELDRELRKALGSNDQLVLVYQPVYAMVSGSRKLAGFEALLRWRHPRLGWMAPNSFIPLAEKSGLILPLGDWVLTRALRERRILQQSCTHPDFQLAVNVSASQLAQPHFCSSLAEMLEAEGFPASALCLEVTESMLTDAAASYVLSNVRNLGVRVAVDDFGTGYSSLSYLRRLPADIVKLDRSFLEDAGGSATAITFIRSIVMLAHSAGMLVVMEGIETQAHLDIALAAGADAVQGFFFARPLSAKAAAELVGAVI
jgi:diguanylate cyclase (GGDEF)-like protein